MSLSSKCRNLNLRLISYLLLLISLAGCAGGAGRSAGPDNLLFEDAAGKGRVTNYDGAGTVTTGTTTAATTPSRLTFSGTWDGAEYGILIMSQEGDNAFGAYEYTDYQGGRQYGYVKGVVAGPSLYYNWWQSPEPGVSVAEAAERGDGYFVLGRDGNRLKGQWRPEGEKTWTNDWQLVRK